MVRKGFVIIIITTILLPILFTTTFIPEQVSGVLCKRPYVVMALTEQSKMANVGPGDSGVVTFTGIVSVTLNQDTKLTVHLYAEDTWDTAVITPDVLVFNSNSDKPFSVTVHVRPKENITNIGTVTVFGRFILYPGNLTGYANPQQGAVGRIEIAKYESFSIQRSDTYKSISPGDDVKFEFTIENRGNYMDDSFNDKFSVDILNERELKNKGFEISIDKRSDDKPICIHVEAPESISGLGYNHIDVQVSYINNSSGDTQVENLTFVIRIPEEKIVYTSEITYLIIIICVILIIIISSKVIRKLRKKSSNFKRSKQ